MLSFFNGFARLRNQGWRPLEPLEAAQAVGSESEIALNGWSGTGGRGTTPSIRLAFTSQVFVAAMLAATFALGSASIAAVSASDKGLAGAAIAAIKGIYALWPRYVFMTGITAGLKKRTGIGDVIFADPSWDWGSGKVKKDHGEEVCLPAPYQRRLDESVVRAAKEFSLDAECLSRAWSEFDGEKPLQMPRVLVGAMASGGSVLQTSEAVRRVLKQHKDVLAIEMGLFAFFSGWI